MKYIIPGSRDFYGAQESIVRIIDKRQTRGVSDYNILCYLNHLKYIWRSEKMHPFLDGLIEGIIASPDNGDTA